MNTKLNFLSYATTHMQNDPEFIAYTLKKYCEFEKISVEELQELLGCDATDYHKLALCRLPENDAPDFTERLTKICAYAGVDLFRIIPVIKRVNTLLKFAANPGNILMAARDKENNKDTQK